MYNREDGPKIIDEINISFGIKIRRIYQRRIYQLVYPPLVYPPHTIIMIIIVVMVIMTVCGGYTYR